jgi:hypothetical protein
MRAAPSQAGGVAALGVHRAGRDDRSGDADAVRQDGEHRDLFDFAPTSTWPSMAP